MIDIHTHILPGLDDGAQTITEAVQMAQIALDDGIEQLVATPHVRWMKADGREKVLSKLGLVREALAEQELPLSVLPGAELYLEPGLASEVQAKVALTLNHGPYALVELPVWEYPTYTEQVIFELQVLGVTPILAHPERVGPILRDVNIVYRLVQRGVLVQITADSLTGGFGPSVKSLAEAMLTHNLAHIIASDAHSPVHRPPTLRAAAERAAEVIEPARAWAMVTSVPQAILDGRPIDVPEPKEYRARKMWGRF